MKPPPFPLIFRGEQTDRLQTLTRCLFPAHSRAAWVHHQRQLYRDRGLLKNLPNHCWRSLGAKRSPTRSVLTLQHQPENFSHLLLLLICFTLLFSSLLSPSHHVMVSDSTDSFYFNPDPVDETAEFNIVFLGPPVRDNRVLCRVSGFCSQRRRGEERKSKMRTCAFPCCLATFEFPLSLSFICELLAVISSDPSFTASMHSHTHENSHYAELSLLWASFSIEGVI